MYITFLLFYCGASSFLTLCHVSATTQHQDLQSQHTPYAKAWGPGLNKGGGTVRPSGASPSPGLAKTSALVHTWIQKGSIPRLTSWRSVISLSTHYHVHITFSLYIPCRANPILSCLPNPQIWSRGLRSPTAVPAGASRSHTRTPKTLYKDKKDRLGEKSASA